MKLSNFTQGRDNNFNLIRVVAAFAVLIHHSFELTIGISDAGTSQRILGINMGSIAVDIFFITSGFLVTGSLLARQSVIDYLWARFLRIFPALMIMLVLTVFGVGVFFTSLPLSSYLSNSKTYIYLIKCTTLITGVAFTLPGVFHGNPYKDIVNSSLWTMPYEIRMYVILLSVFIVLRVIKSSRLRLLQIAFVAGAVVAGVLVILFHVFFPKQGISLNTLQGSFLCFFPVQLFMF